MMQINVNPATLTKDQREALAGFILTYPIDQVVLQKLGDEEVGKLADKIVSIGNKQVLDPADNPATGALEPVEAFADPVAVAFGGVAPLPHGATAAPYTAVASALTTAPEVVAETGANLPTAPLPPAPPFVPSAPTAAPTETNLAPVDSANFPWDARIHSESKVKIANGTWKKKRGVDPALVATVEQELAGVTVSTTATCAVTLPNPAWPFTPPNAPTPPVSPTPSALVQTLTVTNATPAGTPTGADPRQEFVKLIGYTSNAMRENKITQAEIDASCEKYGVAKLPLLANNLNLVEFVANEIYTIVTGR